MKQEEEFVSSMLSVFDAADLDGDGSIDFSEFIKNEWQVHFKIKFNINVICFYLSYVFRLLIKNFS